MEHSKAFSEATGIRRIEPVQGGVMDVADEVADEGKRRFTRPIQERNTTQSDEQGSS